MATATEEKAEKKTFWEWEHSNFINQLLFFLLGTVFFYQAYIKGGGKESFVFYFAISVVWLIVAAVNSALPKNTVRHTIGLTILIVNTFIIPFLIYSCGRGMDFALIASLAYIIITMAISPRGVAFVALLAAIGFSCFLHHCDKQNIKDWVGEKESASITESDDKKPEDKSVKFYTVKSSEKLKLISSFPEVYGDSKYWGKLYDANQDKIKDPSKPVPKGTVLVVPYKKVNLKMDFAKISIAFLAAALIAYFWRLLIQKLYQLCKLAIQKTDTGVPSEALEEMSNKLDTNLNEQRQLKEEIALHIIEMNKFMVEKK